MAILLPEASMVPYNKEYCFWFLDDCFIIIVTFCSQLFIRLHKKRIMVQYPTTNDDEVKAVSKPLIGSTGPDFTFVDHEAFRAKFGITVPMCTKVWNMVIQKLNCIPPIQGFGRTSVLHILYALFFLKMYPTARQATSTVGRSVGRNQFQRYAKFFI